MFSAQLIYTTETCKHVMAYEEMGLGEVSQQDYEDGTLHGAH